MSEMGKQERQSELLHLCSSRHLDQVSCKWLKKKEYWGLRMTVLKSSCRTSSISRTISMANHLALEGRMRISIGLHRKMNGHMLAVSGLSGCYAEGYAGDSIASSACQSCAQLVYPHPSSEPLLQDLYTPTCPRAVHIC